MASNLTLSLEKLTIHEKLQRDKPRRRSSHSESSSGDDSSSHDETAITASCASSASGSFVHSYQKKSLPERSQYVAMDCEMVGGISGTSLCARVVLVDWKGRILLDTCVAPVEPIEDYRTYVSGISEEDLIGAPSLSKVQQQVLELLEGKILVGHALINDLEALRIQHPWHMQRDTATYPPFMRNVTSQDGQSLLLPRKLKELVHDKLGDKQFQSGVHDPMEDALGALNLYKQHRPRWEACVQSNMKKAHQEQAFMLRQQQHFYYMQQMLPMGF
jgi:RNA exonuclease 4